ncbi:MAG: hypothetical protein IIZ51_06105 [Lachnospiraceae bacterium]|nr:hypothetical protein [Lachnospiraceae bacterium]MBQ1515406.1 hypothetical protein [Lachnospiraceae bacterium]
MEKKLDLTKYPKDTKTKKKYVITDEEKEKSKYSKLVFEFPKEDNEVVAEGDPADFVVHPQAYFRGARQIPGSNFNCSFQIFVKPFFLDRMQHVHPNTDEYLIFLGASFPDVFDFDARIELTLGTGEDAETYVITKPTIVRFPAGLTHCPLDFQVVNKPILFLAASMMPMFGGIYTLEDGSTTEMYYNGPLPCKYDENKKCDACGKCLFERWEKD